MSTGQVEQRMKAVLNRKKLGKKQKKTSKQRSRDTGGQLKQLRDSGHKSAAKFKMKGEKDYPPLLSDQAKVTEADCESEDEVVSAGP